MERERERGEGKQKRKEEVEVEWKEGIKYKIINYHLLLTEGRRWKRKKDKRRSKCRERERGGKMDMHIQR